MNFKRGVAASPTNIKTDVLEVQKRLIVMLRFRLTAKKQCDFAMCFSNAIYSRSAKYCDVNS